MTILSSVGMRRGLSINFMFWMETRRHLQTYCDGIEPPKPVQSQDFGGHGYKAI